MHSDIPSKTGLRVREGIQMEVKSYNDELTNARSPNYKHETANDGEMCSTFSFQLLVNNSACNQRSPFR